MIIFILFQILSGVDDQQINYTCPKDDRVMILPCSLYSNKIESKSNIFFIILCKLVFITPTTVLLKLRNCGNENRMCWGEAPRSHKVPNLCTLALKSRIRNFPATFGKS